MTPTGPTAQHRHRAPIATPRPHSSTHHGRLAARLTVRDRWLLRMLHEHHVLTTPAITTMAFPSARAARLRLLQLYRWDILDRFQPLLRVGAAPMHYVLGGAGASVVAAQAGVDATTLGWRRERVLAVAHQHRLAHTVAINELFAQLVAHSGPAREPRATRAAPQTYRLDAWWSEARLRRLVGDIVRPDAYGRLSVTPARATNPHPPARDRPDQPAAFEWFLELDFGESTLAALAGKITRYAQLAAVTAPVPVLVWLPGPRREHNARQHLRHALQSLDDPRLVPIATTTPHCSIPDPTEPVGDALRWFTPTGPIWLPVSPPSTRTAGTGRDTDARLSFPELAGRWPAPPTPTPAVDPPAHVAGRDALAAPHPLPPTPESYNPAHTAPGHYST